MIFPELLTVHKHDSCVKIMVTVYTKDFFRVITEYVGLRNYPVRTDSGIGFAQRYRIELCHVFKRNSVAVYIESFSVLRVHFRYKKSVVGCSCIVVTDWQLCPDFFHIFSDIHKFNIYVFCSHICGFFLGWF